MALLAGAGFAQSPDAVIHSSVREVLLDIVVRDTHGRLITNLKPDELTVYEDGVRQPVRSFRLVAGREVRVEDEKQAAEVRAAATAAPGTAPAPAPSPSNRPASLWIGSCARTPSLVSSASIPAVCAPSTLSPIIATAC